MSMLKSRAVCAFGDEVELGRLHHWQIPRLVALEDAKVAILRPSIPGRRDDGRVAHARKPTNGNFLVAAGGPPAAIPPSAAMNSRSHFAILKFQNWRIKN
jgi:hypothetical protein